MKKIIGGIILIALSMTVVSCNKKDDFIDGYKIIDEKKFDLTKDGVDDTIQIVEKIQEENKSVDDKFVNTDTTLVIRDGKNNKVLNYSNRTDLEKIIEVYDLNNDGKDEIIILSSTSKTPYMPNIIFQNKDDKYEEIKLTDVELEFNFKNDWTTLNVSEKITNTRATYRIPYYKNEGTIYIGKKKGEVTLEDIDGDNLKEYVGGIYFTREDKVLANVKIAYKFKDGEYKLIGIVDSEEEEDNKQEKDNNEKKDNKQESDDSQIKDNVQEEDEIEKAKRLILATEPFKNTDKRLEYITVMPDQLVRYKYEEEYIMFYCQVPYKDLYATTETCYGVKKGTEEVYEILYDKVTLIK